MIIPGRLLVFITVLHNGSVAVARCSSRPEAVHFFFFLPPDKDNATNALLVAFHFYLTLGGRLSLMRVDNMASGFQRCWSARHTKRFGSKLPPRRTAGGFAPAVRHRRIRSEEEISRCRGPLPCRQRGEQMTFVSLEVSSRCILCS